MRQSMVEIKFSSLLSDFFSSNNERMRLKIMVAVFFVDDVDVLLLLLVIVEVGGIFFSNLTLLVRMEGGTVGREIFDDGIFFRRFRCGGSGRGSFVSVTELVLLDWLPFSAMGWWFVVVLPWLLLSDVDIVDGSWGRFDSGRSSFDSWVLGEDEALLVLASVK